MSDGIVNKAGRLHEKFLPAVYFDSSVLIDYWLTEGLEIERPRDTVAEIISQHEPKHIQVIRELLNTDKRIEKVIELRKRLIFEETKVTAIISPLCLLELMEWNAEAAFKQIAAEASGALTIQKRGKKEIGDYLKKLLGIKEG